jgi:hypothetical protein
MINLNLKFYTAVEYVIKYIYKNFKNFYNFGLYLVCMET